MSKRTRRPFIPGVLTGWRFEKHVYHSPTCPLHSSRNPGTVCNCQTEPDYGKFGCKVIVKNGERIYENG